MRPPKLPARWAAMIGLLAVAVMLICLNMLADRYLAGVQLDLTQGHIYTLSRGTREILAGLREPVTLRLFYSRALGGSVSSYGAYADRVRELLRHYAEASGGHVRLEFYDPEPFSAVEDRAIGYGLRGVPLDRGGDTAYFGLVGTNLLDDERTVPFFQPDRERFLEYDLTRMIHELSDPRRPVVGVMSALPLDGAGPSAGGDPGFAPFVTMTQLRQAFAVRGVPVDATAIDPAIQALLVIHPQHLTPPTLYAIDQFVMRGGRLLVMVDPHSETQAALPDAAGSAGLGTASDLEPLLSRWGVRFDPTHVVGDPDGAWRVTTSADPHQPPIDYLPWFNINGSGIAADDPATGDLEQVTVASAGSLSPRADAKVQFIPLLRAGPRAGLIPTGMVNDQPDPGAILAGFRSSGDRFVIAARLRGALRSAFPAPPSGAAAAPPYVAATSGPANVVVVADSDVMADRFWIRMGTFMGQPQPVPFSDNGAFVVNLAGTLAGGDALLGLRARGGALRPLTLIDSMQRTAEDRYRETEQALRAHLDTIKKKLDDLRAGRDASEPSARAVMSQEQQAVIDQLTSEVAATRVRLRQVQLSLREDIDSLERQVRLVDVALMPALVALGAIALSIARQRRRRRARRARLAPSTAVAPALDAHAE
jgi:ABC-type uncharacterized transport system involved in gliding motility auxiliary subunit